MRQQYSELVLAQVIDDGLTAAGGIDEESDVAHVAEFAHDAFETADDRIHALRVAGAANGAAG